MSEEGKQEQEDEVAENNLHTKALWQPPNPTWLGDPLSSFPLLQKVPKETLRMVSKSGIGFNFTLALPAVLSLLG